MYQIFTDYKPSTPSVNPTPSKPEFPPFPPLIMASYSSIVSSLPLYLPSFLRQITSFAVTAGATITPSVVVSLAYRLFVFYAATRIIPAVRDENSASVRGGEAMSKLLDWYSPCILVSVYTHLLMQHLEVADGEAGRWESGMSPTGGLVWRWVNVGATSKLNLGGLPELKSALVRVGLLTVGCLLVVLYAFELKHGDHDGGELTSHWKTD